MKKLILFIGFFAPMSLMAQGLTLGPAIKPVDSSVVETISPAKTAGGSKTLAPMSVPGLPLKTPVQPPPGSKKPNSNPTVKPTNRPADRGYQNENVSAGDSEDETFKKLLQNSPVAPKLSLKSPPPRIEVRAGRNAQFAIAQGPINRLVTPFNHPMIKTATDVGQATIKTEGRVIYVATNLSESISLFVFDKSSPEDVMALTLVPSQIPAVSVSIRMAGYESRDVTVAGVDEKAKRFENEQPYTEAIKTLFRELALGRVPSGYSLETISNVPAGMPACRMAGVTVRPAQILTGYSIVAIVARVENRTAGVINLNEKSCQARNVLAVTAWPSLQLQPYEQTELFIAIRRPMPGDGSERPSTLAGGY